MAGDRRAECRRVVNWSTRAAPTQWSPRSGACDKSRLPQGHNTHPYGKRVPDAPFQS